MYQKILVGIDGSPQSIRAAKAAGEMARLTGADLYLVVAYDPVTPDLGEPYQDMIVAARIEDSEKVYADVLDACGETKGLIVKEILEGPPAEAILSVAETRGIDLIIMGTRGLGRFSSLLLGSQSLKVISQAKCPVLLIH
jgi:nucleotide-binding universal stress UspA family protein